MLTLQSRLCRSPDFLTAEMEGELVMMDIENGAYYHLDEIGMEVWNRLEQPAEIAHLCAELAQLYEADIDAIQADVLEFLSQLAARKLVVVEDRPAV